MASPPKIEGLVPRREAEDDDVPTPAPAKAQRTTSLPTGAVSWARPKHDKMNLYPTLEAKEAFVNAVDDLTRDAGRVEGKKLNDGLVHDAALRFALANWDQIRALFGVDPKGE